nr:DEAD/DEAH box helicase family protein [Rappaport israeli]
MLAVFNKAHKINNPMGENPTIELSANVFAQNIQQIQQQNHIESHLIHQDKVLDISMETGTGKTYTYAQTMFEMHKQLGIYKFIIAVPTLSIKAGAEQFLKSEALKQHFRLDFEGEYGDTEIELYVVKSQKSKKSKNKSKNHPMP